MLLQHLLGMRCYPIRLTAIILALEARSAQSRTIGLRHHLQPRVEPLAWESSLKALSP